MIGRLSAAARGGKNVASTGGEEALARMPRSNNKGLGRMSAGSPAGYNAGKSAYIQNTKAGYQARPHNQNSLSPPRSSIETPTRPSLGNQVFNMRKPDHSRVLPDLSRFS